jgi:group I intron endonuclease
MKISGIYKIQSLKKPHRIYVGSGVNIQRRWRDHLRELRKGIHYNPKLQNHFNKYGESDLIFSVIIGCEKCDLIRNEQFFIDAFNPYFNVCLTAGSRIGVKHSIETISKMKGNQNAKGKKHFLSDDTKLKMSSSKLKMTDDTKLKMSKAKKGNDAWSYREVSRKKYHG